MARILVTGATGFVGSHLVDKLLEDGHSVVAGTRHPEDAHDERPGLTFCHIDLADTASIAGALAKVDRAAYLVHGMTSADDYDQLERRYAENFVAALEKHPVERVVYLGGPRPRGKLSRHLASRLRTGEILRKGPAPVVELQATMIVGARSESFRIVRDLAARLPAMLLPKWLKSRSEPIAIDDITNAIAFALDPQRLPIDESIVLGAPGREVLTGREMIERTARVMGHEPVMVDVPVLTPKMSKGWLRLVTRANPHVAGELVEGLLSDIVARGPTIWQRMPSDDRLSFDEAVRRAVMEEEAMLTKPARAIEGVLHQIAREPRPTH